MRQRTAGLIALGVGVFLLVFAVLLRFYAVPTLEVVPKDYWTHYLATGTGKALDAGTGQTVDNLAITQDITIKGDTSPQGAPSNSVVWNYASELSYNTPDGKACAANDTSSPFQRPVCPLSWSNETVALDKKTGKSLAWSGDKVDNGSTQDGGSPVNGIKPHHVGYISKFDFDTAKSDQPLWDDTLANALGENQPPAKYTGTKQVSDSNGGHTITANEYVQTIGTPQQPVHVYDTTTIPPQLVNSLVKQGTKVPVYEYSVTTALIDPTSGIPVAGDQHIVLTAGPTDGTEPTYLTLLDADLKLDKVQQTTSKDLPLVDSSQNPIWVPYTDQSLRDARDADRITLIKSTLPLTSLIAGLLLLLLGVFLIIRGETTARRATTTGPPPATDPNAPTKQLPAVGSGEAE
jgi:hypothetical protein